MSFQFCFFKQLDKLAVLLKDQIISPFFNDFFSRVISTVINISTNNIYQYKVEVTNC